MSKLGGKNKDSKQGEEDAAAACSSGTQKRKEEEIMIPEADRKE